MWGDMRMITVRYSQFYFDVILVIVEYWMMMTVPQLRHTVRIKICMICILVLYTYIEKDSTAPLDRRAHLKRVACVYIKVPFASLEA